MSTLRDPHGSRPRIYLVRHGETDWNAAGRLLSRTDMELNEAGEAQASKLATELQGVQWARVFTSPLLRARRTAEVLAAASGSPSPITDDRLVEMDFGPYEGWSEAELEADPVAVTRRRDGAELPGIEPASSVEARARSFFADVATGDHPTLVVGHGRMLRILIATCVLGLPAGGARSLRMRNCRPAIVEPGPPPLLLGFNVGPAVHELRPASARS